jgi:hypothetical protein
MNEEYSEGILAMIGLITICAVAIYLILKVCIKFVKFLKKKQSERLQIEEDCNVKED